MCNDSLLQLLTVSQKYQLCEKVRWRFFIYKLNKNVRRGVLSCCSVGVIMQVQTLLGPFLSFRC